MPPESEWNHLIFGRGSADQLGGVVAAIVATKILLELAGEGALKGVIVRSYATVCEEDNDGAGPMYLVRKVFPTAPPEVIPDVVILTDGTGCSKNGALGIYRGQRGRMQIEVTVTGRSCHGSMPWEGLNPLRVRRRPSSRRRPRSTRSARASWTTRSSATAPAPPPGPGSTRRATAPCRTSSSSASTAGSPSARRPEQAVADVEKLDGGGRGPQGRPQGRGDRPDLHRPVAGRASRLDNPQIYLGWVTPEEHPAIQAAVSTYRGVISPHVDGKSGTGGAIPKEPRVARWVFSTDGVGFPVPKDAAHPGGAGKNWVDHRRTTSTRPCSASAPGIEQNTHKIGECLDQRELQHCAAFLARFPSRLRAGGK